jgi:hypothetical protein
MEYSYVIGPNPYDNAMAWRQKGNGIWNTKADCLQSALEAIFDSMSVPAELTGRHYGQPFVEGVSLPLPDEEVIQVWSTDPVATANRAKMEASGWDHIPHWDDKSMTIGGLHCEIPVTDIEKYLRPKHHLLTGASSEDSAKAVSSIGANVQEFAVHKHELMAQVTDQQWAVTVQQWELERVQEKLANQIAEVREKMHMADTYLHGIKSKVQLFRGERGTGPYHVYQQRQFLNREVGLLANLTKFDFQNMEQLDEWLVKEGRLFKMLPFERTILVTRIRDTEKNYGNAFSNYYFNIENRVSVIWIRDGKNVYRVNVDIDFDNCVFPSGDESDKMIRYVVNYVFDEIYKRRTTDSLDRPISKEPEGQIKKNALEEEFPYNTHTKFPARFRCVEEWMDSEDYTTKLSVEIAKSCNAYLTQANRRRMKFVLLLQGIVDTTDFLDIPKGANLFDSQVAATYFTLLNDYTHALPDGYARDLIAAVTEAGQLRIGDTIIAYDADFEEDPDQHHRLMSRRSTQWRFYKIVSLKDGIKVMHHFRAKRWPNLPVKVQKMVTVGKQPFIRANITQDMVNMLLDDREWKLNNSEIVPLLAQWPYVQEQYKDAVNFTPLKLKTPEGDDYAS